MRPPRRPVLLAATAAGIVGLGTAGWYLDHRPAARSEAPPPHSSSWHAPQTAPPTSAPASISPGRTAAASTAAASTAAASTAAARLRRQHLFVAEGRETEVVNGAGTVLLRLGPSAGQPAQPVATGNDTVVYRSGGEAYALDLATSTDPVPLGRADEVVAAGPGVVALVTPWGRNQRIRMVGDVLSAIYGFAISGTDRVVAASADGLLTETRHQVLDLYRATDGRTVPVAGPISHLVAFAGNELAWTSQAGCQLVLTSDCPLHLTDVVTGVDRVVRPPGAIGFAAVGAFSPDGRFLAVYELAGRPQRASGLDLVVVRISTGATRTYGSVLVAGPVTPTVAWSPSGEWLYFGGSGSFDAIDFSPPDPVGASGRPVPIPLSVSCCVVGF